MELVELDRNVGEFLVSSFEANPQVGRAGVFGWAGWFDVTVAPDIPGDVVIVGLWPDGKMRVESFSHSSWATWRWLMWDEQFCIQDVSPINGDMILLQHDDGRLMDARSKATFDDWVSVVRFVKRVGLFKRNRNLWFLDRPSGNYYLLDL